MRKDLGVGRKRKEDGVGLGVLTGMTLEGTERTKTNHFNNRSYLLVFRTLMPMLYLICFSKEPVNYDCICFITNQVSKTKNQNMAKQNVYPGLPIQNSSKGCSRDADKLPSLQVVLDRFQSQMEPRKRPLLEPQPNKLMGRCQRWAEKQ